MNRKVIELLKEAFKENKLIYWNDGNKLWSIRDISDNFAYLENYKSIDLFNSLDEDFIIGETALTILNRLEEGR